MTATIHIDIDKVGECVCVYVASPDGLEDHEQHDQVFSWSDPEDDYGLAQALASAEAYANRLSWSLGYEIKKNYGDIT
jgi:hypothetical protein